MYFCAACKVYVEDTNVTEHDMTTTHMITSSQGVSLQKVWLPEMNRGYHMLKAMGWPGHGGLGPTGDGRVTPVAAIMKMDKVGIGGPSTSKRASSSPHKQQMQIAVDGSSQAQCIHDRLVRKRKLSVEQSKAQRKLQKRREKRLDQVIGNELYSEGLEGYEEYLR
ncbi:hypothetical protein CCR75_007469 [Bremia lactucae]|uniref:G-patch domain-containing protein n=1 Tax=Bremia lactucae TaxID=4779 RepID=A0A976IDT2_BRELC|nr:hypothetical protein CCR75_007469 [Bremia lactucae]